MADSDQQIVMLDPGTHLMENGEIVTVANTNEVDQEVNDDILKQALEEASKGFDENEEEYGGETVQVVADSNGQLTEANTVVGEDGTTYTLVPAGDGTDTMHAVPTHVQTLDEQPLLQLQDDKSMEDDTVVATDNGDSMDHHSVTIQDMDSDMHEGETIMEPMENSIGSQSTTRTVTVVTTNSNGEALGTSDNPIRIIQQGNQYTSMQQLSAEQLAQIMQVVQQQQLARNSAGGSTVLYNPQTQTRIVYKVIYPSELHGGKIAIPGVAKNDVNGPRQITVPKSMVTVGAFGRRQYKKRTKEEEEKFDGPELSKEEKEEKKKHRPRTRSGRVSKPPKHMVKDYKHIHHLDWDEDYDDSDGGYSDFRLSEEEEDDDEGSVDRGDKPYINAGLLSNKPKEYKCDKCPKAYIGKAGLARHYRLYPDHGDAEELIMGSGGGKNGLDGSLTDESTQDSIGSASNQSQQTVTSTTSTTSQPNPQLVESKGSSVSSPSTTATTSVTPSVVRLNRPGPGRPRGSRSRHHFFYGENSVQRRKFKLKELMKQCTNEELMEIVLPRLARVITLWEFLMMKVEKGRPAKPNIQDVCSEFEELHKHVKKMCQDQLQLLGVQSSASGQRCQLKDEDVARSLGFSAGIFAVKEKILKKPQIDDYVGQPVRFKVVNSDAGIVQKISHPVKRVAVSPEQAIAPKKQRILFARDDTQSRTMVLHTNSTNPIQTVPGRSLLKSSPNVMLTTASNVISSPQAQTIASSNSGMMQPSPITAGGQYSIIKVGQANSTSAAVHQPQQVLVSSQSQIIHTSLGQTMVLHPQAVVRMKDQEDLNDTEQHENGQQEIEMQEDVNSVQEAAETTNLNSHFDAVEHNTQDGLEAANSVIDVAPSDGGIEEHQVISNGEESQVYLQQAAEDEDGEVLKQDGESELVVEEGDTTQILLQEGEDGEHQVIEGANIFQTEDGLILIQNPDGTFQIHGNSDQPIPLETVQALLAMDGQLQEGQQVLQVQEQMQVEEHEQMHVQQQEHLVLQDQDEIVGQQQFEEEVT